MLLAIETSCDETAVCLFDEQSIERGDMRTALRYDVVSSQVALHQPYGGVVPELAAREHVRNLPVLVNEALQSVGITTADISAIGVTRGPGLKGSLLVGLCFAKSFALASNIPLIPVHHIEGHIFAGNLSDTPPIYPFLALVVSGGHTMLVLCESYRRYRLVASTRDDAAGEAFDKTATLLGLPYPGGPQLSRAAERGNASAFSFPIGVAGDSKSFSFSGLKTAVQRQVQQLGASMQEPQVRDDLAASVQSAIVQALVRKVSDACRVHSPRALLLTGGVAANALLRQSLADEAAKLGIPFAVPAARWCTDNAAMIAVLAYHQLQENREAFESWTPHAGFLGPGVSTDLGAVAKWPLPCI